MERIKDKERICDMGEEERKQGIRIKKREKKK